MSNLEGPVAEISWDERGLVPVVVQDALTNRVLMLAYMNADALARTLQSGETWFWSRSRRKLWHKGATSGNTQRIVELHYDCDGDTLLVRVNPRGPACHTGQTSCFYRRLPGSPSVLSAPSTGSVLSAPSAESVLSVSSAESAPSADPDGSAGKGVLDRLWSVIQNRKANPKDDSYTCHLLSAGEPEMLKKLGEEAIEVIVAAQSEGDERLVSELADLAYHALVLLAARELSWTDVEEELARRFGQQTTSPLS